MTTRSDQTSAATQPASLAGAPWLTRAETQAVLAMLEAGGFAARVVGGCVRNALLGRPVTDIDIATPALPETVMRLATAAGFKCVPTGIAHGTVTVVVAGQPFEVTTLRRDVSTDGRRATVAFTDDWREDASRRDFTINALYADRDGRIDDPLGGMPDLLARRVRFIGAPEARIREDYLRILRFFRFHAQYATGPMDGDGLRASIALSDGLARLSGERIRQELMRLLVAPGVGPAVRTLCESGLMTKLTGLAPRPGALEHMIAIETAVRAPPSPTLRLGALLVMVAEAADRLAERLRLSRAEAEHLHLYADCASRREGPDDERAARARLYRAADARTYRTEVLARWSWSGACADAPDWARVYDLPDRWTAPKFPLTGEDVQALGVAPGPAIGALLSAVERDWIGDDFRTDRAALLLRLADAARRQ